MLTSVRQWLSKAIAPNQSQVQSGQKSYHRQSLSAWLHQSALGSTVELQQNKYGAALAFNITVPVYTGTQARVKTVSRAYWTIKDSNDNIIYDSEGTGKGNLLTKAIRDFENEFDLNFFGAWELSRTVAGETFIHLVANDFDVINGIEWLNPLDVQVYAPMGKRVRYDYSPHGERLQIPLERMVFDRELNLTDENAGQSPIEVAIRKAQTIINGDLTMLSHLKNNARAGMTVSPARGTQNNPKQSEFSNEDMDAIESQIIKTMRGSYNHNSTVVLPFPVDINTYEIADLKPVIGLMDRVDKSIYEVLGVPPSIAGNPDTARFQRSELDIEVFDRMIVNELTDIQHYVNRKILPTFDPSGQNRFEFDISPFLHVSNEDIRIAELSMSHYGQGIIDKRAAIQMNSSLYRTRGIDVDRLFKDLEAEEQAQLEEPTTQEPTKDANDETEEVETNEEEAPETKAVKVIGNEVAIPSDTVIITAPSDKQHTHDYNIKAIVDSFDEWSIDKAIGELNAYRKFIGNTKLSKRQFVPDYIAGDIFDDIEATDHKTQEIDRQISHLQTVQKSIEGLATEFRNAFERIITDAKSRDSLFTQLNNLVTRMGTRAYEQGLENAGVRDEPNSEDRAKINQLQSTHTNYINDFADKMFSDNPPSEAQLERKPEQWVNKTLYEFYHEGLLSGRKNPMLEWQLDPAKDNCTDCARLNGQRHRAKDWKQSGWKPKDSRLECNGDDCGCEFKRTVSRSRGNF